MHEFCRHCQNLLRQVYCSIYRVDPESVEFIMTPMPRLEVESVNDLKVLFEIGALTPDMSVELSRVLLGNTTRPKPSLGAKRSREEIEKQSSGDSVLPANNNKNRNAEDKNGKDADNNGKRDTDKSSSKHNRQKSKE